MTNAPVPQCQPMAEPVRQHYPLPWVVGPFGDVWVSADVELKNGQWRETVPEPRIVVTLGLKDKSLGAFMVEACNSHASLKADNEQLRKALNAVSVPADVRKMKARIEDLETEAVGMKKAIRGLCIELEGVWDAFEYGLRAEISNTNYVLIRQKIEDARAALPQSSGVARAEK